MIYAFTFIVLFAYYTYVLFILIKPGLPSWFINQPDGSGPKGPLPHLKGAAGRDQTHVTPDVGCRSAN